MQQPLALQMTRGYDGVVKCGSLAMTESDVRPREFFDGACVGGSVLGHQPSVSAKLAHARVHAPSKHSGAFALARRFCGGLEQVASSSGDRVGTSGHVHPATRVVSVGSTPAASTKPFLTVRARQLMGLNGPHPGSSAARHTPCATLPGLLSRDRGTDGPSGDSNAFPIESIPLGALGGCFDGNATLWG